VNAITAESLVINLENVPKEKSVLVQDVADQEVTVEAEALQDLLGEGVLLQEREVPHHEEEHRLLVEEVHLHVKKA